MTNACRVALLSAMLWMPHAVLMAESGTVELRWSELASTIGGHRVELALTEGKKVSGEVLSVRADSLVLDVAVPAEGFVKGSSSIPRTSVSLIKLERSHGTWGRGMGTTLGVITGAGVGGYVSTRAANSVGPAIPIFLGLTGSTAVAGYYLGRQLDRRVTVITIAPESRAAVQQ